MDRPLDLSSRYGRGDGINANKDRQSIYGHTEPTFDVRGMISDRSFIRNSGFDENEAFYQAKKRYKKWCLESIETWDVVTGNGQDETCRLAGVSTDTVMKSWKQKKIVSGHFAYPQGQRPTEEEIDAMLDAFEAFRARQYEMLSRIRRRKN